MATAIAIVPLLVDINYTHATNPLWPPHARFHVVWQCLIQAGIGFVILKLLWPQNHIFNYDCCCNNMRMRSMDYPYRVEVANTLLFIFIGPFYVTMSTMKLFGGALADVNGVPPIPLGPLGSIDSNLLAMMFGMSLNLYVLSSIRDTNRKLLGGGSHMKKKLGGGLALD